MKKRIFKSISFVGILIFIVSFVLTSAILHNYFIEQQQKQQLDEARLVAHAVENEGEEYFKNLKDDDFRITWIDSKGVVLYDSDSSVDKMDNHLSRSEIHDAAIYGEGQSRRYSKTLTSNLLYSAIKLNDGTILRLSSTYYTIWVLMILMIQPILILAIFAISLSLICANSVSKKLVKPINDIDLEKPLRTNKYPELNPFLMKIFTQQNQLKKQASQLERKNKEFEAITSNLSEGIVLLNIDNSVIVINNSAKKIFDYDIKNTRNFCSICKNESLLDLLKPDIELKHKTINTKIDDNDYEVVISPIVEKNQIIGKTLLLINEKEKKQAEKIRRDFTTNVSHELKTPLQVISGYSELLNNDEIADEDKKIFAKKIYSESQKMISLVNDVIKLSHLEEDINTDLQDVDLSECLDNVVNSLKEAAIAKNIDVSLNKTSVTVKSIPMLLQGAFYNICDNAIKYNKNNGRVDITIFKEDDKAIVKISDTGIGISKDDVNRIFERFFRANKSRSKENGETGLGLSIAKHTIERLNGNIYVESVLNEGTTFTIVIPLGK